jgi:hypothetical protein
MLRLISMFACVTLLSANGFAASKTKPLLSKQTIEVVDLRETISKSKAKSQTVSLMNEDMDFSMPVLVRIPTEATAPKVELDLNSGSQCEEVEITVRHNPQWTHGGTIVFLEVEFGLDDGANMCVVNFELASGKRVSLELGFDVDM